MIATPEVKRLTDEITRVMEEVEIDLMKGCAGSAAAAQRARVGSVKLEKLFKLYRKFTVSKR